MRVPAVGRGRAQHAQEAPVLDHVADHEAHQEAVVDRRQLVLLGQLVGRAEDGQQRHLDAVAAVVEAALVEQREQRVQDRRARLEDLVEERDVRLGQLVRRDAAVLVLLERAQAHRAEHLLGGGELGEQPLEVARAVDAPAELVGKHRLRGAGRSEQQHVLAGQQGRERALDHLAALDEDLAELAADRGQLGARGLDVPVLHAFLGTRPREPATMHGDAS